MPIRPFPSPFRVGIDIIRVERMRSIVSQPEDQFQRFLNKIFTTRERRYMKALFPKIPGASKHEVTLLTEYLASRWAAKEAAIKAVKPRKLTLMEVEIWPNEIKAPFAIILNAKTPTASSKNSKSAKPDEEDSKEVQTGDDETRDAILQALEKDHASPTNTESTSDETEPQVKIDGVNNKDPKKKSNSEEAYKVLKAILKEDCDGQIARVSISHDGDYACAVVLATEEPALDDVGGEAAARGYA